MTRRYIRNLLMEAEGVEGCKLVTQKTDKGINTNKKKKAAAAENEKIAYGPPNRPELKKLVDQNKLCGNCAAFDVTKKMQKCMGEDYKQVTAKFLIKNKKRGYCRMHDFMCSAHKTCLTWAPNGPAVK